MKAFCPGVRVAKATMSSIMRKIAADTHLKIIFCRQIGRGDLIEMDSGSFSRGLILPCTQAIGIKPAGPEYVYHRLQEAELPPTPTVKNCAPLLLQPLSTELVQTALETMRPGSSPSIDGIPADVFVQLAPAFREFIPSQTMV